MCQQCQGAGDGWWMRTIEAERWGCGPPLQYLARWVGQGTGGMRLLHLCVERSELLTTNEIGDNKRNV